MTPDQGEGSAPLVLFAEYTDLDPEPARHLLGEHGVATDLLSRDASGRVDPAQSGAIGLIAGYSRIDSGLLDQLPSLGIIAASSNGTDMIDVEIAKARGIWVTNVGHAATEEVAVHALGLVLAAIRGLPEMNRIVADGGWTDDCQWVPRRISELTLGLVGYGRIGAELARIAAPLFGRVIAYDPFNTPNDGIVTASGLAETIAGSDVLSLHVPLTPETRSLLGAQAISTMRRGAVLINVSRGELVDLEACRLALDEGALSWVGFDVLDGEPPAAEHPLRSHPRAIVTPHAAFLSDAALRRYETDPARYIAEWMETGSPSACVVSAPER